MQNKPFYIPILYWLSQSFTPFAFAFRSAFIYIYIMATTLQYFIVLLIVLNIYYTICSS
jgi:hypothetical protein